MTVYFSNPRLSAIPCERMRGCAFAEDFVTDKLITDNHGVLTLVTAHADHGLYFDGNDTLYYTDFKPSASESKVTIKLQFKSTVKSLEGTLIGTGDFISGVKDGFHIWVDADGVKANHGNAGSYPTQCSVDIEYDDGVLHTVTYVFDADANTHTLYVDALDPDEQATSFNDLYYNTNLRIGGNSIGGSPVHHFTGYIYSLRIFYAALTQAEHDIYHDGALTSFIYNPYACYRCDSWGDDSTGHYIWDRTLNMYDLEKADRVTASKFPTFDGSKYTFDLVDDYVSDSGFDLPAEYTITAITSSPQVPYHSVVQGNNRTFLDILTTEGQFWGHLHSMIIHDSILEPIQLLHDRYQQLTRLSRERATGQYHRLIAEGTCKLAMFPGSDYGVFTDYSLEQSNGTSTTGVVRNGLNGCTFPAGAAIVVQDRPSLRITDGTIFAFGNFDTSGAAGALVDKYAYNLKTNGNNITCCGSTIAHTFSSNTSIAVTFKSGYKPRFYVDGYYIGDGDITVSPSGVDTHDLMIGAEYDYSDQTPYSLMQVCICDEPLTDLEILSLHEQAAIIGETSMEAGSRIQPTPNVATGTAVNYTVDPGSAFQLIDIAMVFNTAPTTSEFIVIKSSSTIIEYQYNPSLSSDTCHVFRFDKRFADGRTINITYTNTDARTITTTVTYQLDQSVV